MASEYWPTDPEADDDWGDDDVVGRRCRNCKRTFQIKRGQKVRYCPFCGAAMVRAAQTQPTADPRLARPWWPRRAKGL